MQKIKYHIGQNLDILDTVNKWVNGEVLFVDEDRIYIHYSGWSAKYDQYIPINSHRILKQWELNQPISINNRLDSYHPIGGWLEARVIEIDQDNPDRGKVHYIDYHNKYDRWVNLKDRNETALIGERTQAYGRGRTRNIKKKLSQQAIIALRDKIKKFIETLQNRKWVMKNIEGDGNCLFRSVSHQLYGDDRYHSQIRQLCMNYIDFEKGFFQDYVVQNIEDYLHRKRQNGQWGDDVEIQAISQIYSRPIQIYAFGDKPIKTFHQENNQNVEPLRLAYVGSCHYNSIKQEQQLNKGLMKSQFGEYESNFLSTYKNQFKYNENKNINKNNRNQFANSNRIQDTIEERVQSEMRLDNKVEDDLSKVLEMSETEAMLQQIQKAQMKQIVNKSEQQRIQQEIRKIEEKQLQEAKKLSKQNQIQRPYWFNDLKNQGYSDKEIEFAIEINGYDPDAVHNFLLDNTYP